MLKKLIILLFAIAPLALVAQETKIAFINAMRDFEKMYTFVLNDDLLILETSA